MFGHDGTSYLIDFDLAVRLFQTFSNHIFTVGTRGGGYIYSISGWLNHSEHPRTFSNNFSAEKAMYIQVFYMSLGWFDSTEPSRTTLSLREQGVQGAYTLVYTPVVLEFSKICGSIVY